MNRTREQLLPILCHWITFLARPLPLRSMSTLIEQAVGALLSRRSWITEAYLAIAAQRHGTSRVEWAWPTMICMAISEIPTWGTVRTNREQARSYRHNRAPVNNYAGL
jgi:hypothetical protein